jgi:hypothetical protein
MGKPKRTGRGQRVRSRLRGIERLEDRLVLAAPTLLAGVMIQNGGSPLYVDSPGFSAPTAVDWNGDGKKDLVVGQFNGGYVWVHLNQGTDANPVCNGGNELLLSNGALLSVPAS